ncbi:MAG: hypothetical protein LBD03_03430 [Methanobrevibacter sp.]|nr:hypothetical protein [Candidatus Methanovirga procula]
MTINIPLIPILDVIVCLSQMIVLPIVTWMRLILWIIVGLIIYWFYGF